MNLPLLLTQATNASGTVDLEHYTRLVLLEAARLVKDTPITGAYTSFDAEVAKTQRAECFDQIYTLIVDSLDHQTRIQPTQP